MGRVLLYFDRLLTEMAAEERTESSAVPSGGVAPTVAAVYLDPKTLEAIIAGVSAQLRGSGALGETSSSGSGGPSAERERRPQEQPEDRRSVEAPVTSGGGQKLEEFRVGVNNWAGSGIKHKSK